MCWFSAREALFTRDAIEGEELVVQEFSEIGRRWFASTQEPHFAVCIRNGCRLRLTEIPDDLQRSLHVGTEALAEFREDYQPPRTFLQRLVPPEHLHDVLVLEDGGHIPARKLPIGIRVDVLSRAKLAPVGKGWEVREDNTVFV